MHHQSEVATPSRFVSILLPHGLRRTSATKKMHYGHPARPLCSRVSSSIPACGTMTTTRRSHCPTCFRLVGTEGRVVTMQHSFEGAGMQATAAQAKHSCEPPGEAETVGPVSAKVSCRFLLRDEAQVMLHLRLPPSFSWGSRLRQPSCPFDAYGCRLLTSVRPNWPQINRKASDWEQG